MSRGSLTAGLMRLILRRSRSLMVSLLPFLRTRNACPSTMSPSSIKTRRMSLTSSGASATASSTSGSRLAQIDSRASSMSTTGTWRCLRSSMSLSSFERARLKKLVTVRVSLKSILSL